MTREEAIEVLTDMRRIRSNTITEACDMAISALEDMPIHFGRCWDCVSFIAEGEKCKWGLLTGEEGYCHHFCEKYGNNITESPNDVVEKNDEVIEPSDLMSHEEAWKQIESDLISRDNLVSRLKRRKKFFIDAWGSFHLLSITDKARVDELDACIAEVVNAPTIAEKHQLSEETSIMKVDTSTNTPTDLISRAEVIADNTVIPSEVVGELVRCKDCEYYDIPTQYRYTNSKLCCRSALQKVEENDFCSWAKMKGGTE